MWPATEGARRATGVAAHIGMDQEAGVHHGVYM
jgi:hypothetical protein